MWSLHLGQTLWVWPPLADVASSSWTNPVGVATSYECGLFILDKPLGCAHLLRVWPLPSGVNNFSMDAGLGHDWGMAVSDGKDVGVQAREWAWMQVQGVLSGRARGDGAREWA